MATYRITALPSAVASVQAVPLIWDPFTGPDAWGTGDPVMIGRGVPDPSGAVYWGVTGDQFQDETTAAATLAGLSDVTVEIT